VNSNQRKRGKGVAGAENIGTLSKRELKFMEDTPEF
jgi:hypothetical protein